MTHLLTLTLAILAVLFTRPAAAVYTDCFTDTWTKYGTKYFRDSLATCDCAAFTTNICTVSKLDKGVQCQITEDANVYIAGACNDPIISGFDGKA